METILCSDIETTIDNRKITRPHVLAGIHSESSHSHVNQLVHVANHLTTYIVLLQEPSPEDQPAYSFSPATIKELTFVI